MTCEPTPLLPTPTAHDDGKSPDAHMRMKRRMAGGARNTITSLSVLARAGFEQPPSVPGSADSTSPSQPRSAATPPGSAKPTPTAAPSLSATGPELTCCPTCGKSTQDFPLSTCCTPGIPASRSPRPANDSGRPTPVTFGPPSSEPFAFFDPQSSCWRTSQLTFDSDSTPCSVTLPGWGSMRSGELYERPTWEPPTDGRDCSSLPGTPNAHERTHSPRAVDHGIQLANQVGELFQTPSAADAMGGHLVKALLPTPGANDMTGGEGPTREARQDHGTGGPALRDIGHLLPTPMSATYEQGGDGGELRAAIQHGPTRRLLPTATAKDAAGSRGHRRDGTPYGPTSGVTLTDALETFSGASTSPPSDDGNTPSDGPPPDQLTIGDA